MDSNTLLTFRNDLYGCFLRAGDALMNTVDALLTDTSARSLAELSLSPFFQRRWHSIYEAFQDASIDRQALCRVFAAQVRPPHSAHSAHPGHPEGRLFLGGDASSIPRPQSPTAKDLTYVHQSNLPEGSKPVTPGWQFSTLSVLPEQPSSWTYVLDNQRIPSDKTQGQVMAEQLSELVSLLPACSLRPLFVGDGYYGSVTFLLRTKAVACDKLTRFPKNRVLYRPAPPHTGKRGAPRKDGEPFKCHDPSTQGPPDEHWESHREGHREGQREGKNAAGQPIEVDLEVDLEVDCWNNLHFRDARDITVSVLRVTRSAAQGTKRDPRVSWFLFTGEHRPPLTEIIPAYRRRYSLEHGYRVDKQDLLWQSVRLRTPEQMQHWTDVVACVRNQLCLARPQVEATCAPWEKPGRPSSPQQVRRSMSRILRELGTPANQCQPRGYSPGQPKGAIRKPAPRFQVVYKATEKSKHLV